MRAPGRPGSHPLNPALSRAIAYGTIAVLSAQLPVLPLVAAAAASHPPRPAAVTTTVLADPDYRMLTADRVSRSRLALADATPSATPSAPPTSAPPAPPARPTPKPTSSPPRPRTAAAPALPAGNVQAVLRYALAQVGDGYSMGAAGPNSWDCSGLVMVAYRQVGISLPHSSSAMLSYGRAVAESALQPGDLVFPDSGHVSLYVGGGKIVEAANPSEGVVYRAIWGFWTARRLL